MEKIKNYQKPTMRVVKLQQRYHLLGDSEINPGSGNEQQSRSFSSDWDNE